MNNKDTKTLNGWISDYWEQGMERMSYRVFQDEDYCKSHSEGWKIDGMYILQSGFELTIFDENEEILWTGVIKSKRTGFLGFKIIYPDDYEWCPEEVEFEIWESWFKKKPPLRARLTISGEN